MIDGSSLGKRITLFLSFIYIFVLAALVLFNKHNANQLSKVVMQHEAELIAESIVVAAANRTDIANFKRIVSAIGANEVVDHALIAKANSGTILASNHNSDVGSSFTSGHFDFSELLNRLKTKQSASSMFYGKQLIHLVHFEVASKDRGHLEQLVILLVINTQQLSNFITSSNQYVFFAALIGFSITLLLSIYTIRSQAISPLYRLLETIRTSIYSKTPKKALREKDDEIGELVDAYNLLLDNLLKQQAKLQQQTLKSKQATKAKSDFLAVMSHEIRTPLNGVLGTASLLAKTDMTAQQKEQLNVITSSGNQLLATINDILDISKIEAKKLVLNPVPCEINQMVKAVVDMFKATVIEKDVNIVAKYAPETVWVELDDIRVKQVLINLISNAIKFTEQGTVSITLDLEQCGDKSYLLSIAIIDTGIGLTEEQISSLFTKFEQADASTTRKYGGTGLGLAICYALITQMGGKIAVSSQPNQGSRFMVTIPCKESASSEFNQQENKQLITAKNLNVLLVDDVSLNRQIASSMLKDHKVTTAENGLDALEKAQQETFDVILMDCLMPELDGFDATRQIRQLNIKVPIIALTASNQSETKAKCLEAGMNDFLSKPLVEQDLLNCIYKWYQS